MTDYYVLDRGPERELVKRGFCWPALCFTWIWALVRHMPMQSLLMFLALNIPLALDKAFPGHLTFHGLIPIAFMVVPIAAGAYGNRWRVRSLEDQGFELTHVDSLSRAERSLIAR